MVDANIVCDSYSALTSIVNPQSGTIRCHSCGEYIHDAGAKAPDDCLVICSADID